MNSKIVAISHHVKKHIAFNFHINLNKIKCIYYGFDTQQFQPSQKAKSIRKEFDLREHDFIIGTVGRLEEQKGHIYLLQGLSYIVESHPDIKTLVVGDGSLKNELFRASNKLNLSQNVIFTGFRKDVADIMTCLDLFVLPSVWEGFGLVLLEAMAMEKPIIATRVSAIPEIVKDGESGILVPPEDSKALASSILRLRADRELRLALGKSGRERLENLFTIDKMVRETEMLYDEMLAEKGLTKN